MRLICFLSKYPGITLVALFFDKLIEATDVIILEHFDYDFPALAALYLIHLGLKAFVLHRHVLRQCYYLYVRWDHLAFCYVYDFVQWIELQVALRALETDCLHFDF